MLFNQISIGVGIHIHFQNVFKTWEKSMLIFKTPSCWMMVGAECYDVYLSRRLMPRHL